MCTVFPLLADPRTYRPCSNDLLVDADARRYWIDLFEQHFEIHMEAASGLGVLEEDQARARRAMADEMQRVRAEPDAHGALDLLVLDARRTVALAAGGIRDPFRAVKERENAVALAELPRHLDAIDQRAGIERLEYLVRGSLAGNLFDMGATHTAGEFMHAAPPFETAMQRVGVRPWRFDDLDRAATWMDTVGDGTRVVLFADNAGGDFVLGALAIVRHLVRLGAEVVIAANRAPCLNDVTIEEVPAIMGAATAIDPVYGDPRVQVVDSGSSAALIDLSRVSDALAAASVGADLVILLGMGRGIESNWDARFTCPCWRLAMIKDPQPAGGIGAKVGDAMCRFDLPST